MELNDTQKLVLLTKLGFCVDSVISSCYEDYKDTKLAISASYNYIKMAYEQTYQEVDSDLHTKAERIRIEASSGFLPKMFQTRRKAEIKLANFEILAKNLREISQLLEGDSRVLQSLQLTRFASDQNLESYKEPVKDLVLDVSQKFLEEHYNLTQVKGKTPAQLRQTLDGLIERIAFDSENSYLKSAQPESAGKSR